MAHQTSLPKLSNSVRLMTVLAMLLGLFGPLAQSTTYAATVSSAAFSGGAGTVAVSGVLYAKNGGALTLTVNTSPDTKCVDVTGAHAARQTSSAAKSTWTFSFSAGSGDGVRTVNISVGEGFNSSNCTTRVNSGTASYVLDNTGPAVTAVLTPAANAAGWNNSNVSIAWSASDAGSGVASGPSPASDSATANYFNNVKTASATDRLGNTGSGSVTVKLDKAAPSITGSRSPGANSFGWNNTDVAVSFTCDDQEPGSGIKSCTGSTTLSGSGAGQSVNGTAIDNADNSASTSVGGVNIDKVAPMLSGAPTTSANAAGWYKSDVIIDWSASDALSGLAAAVPTDSTISGEGSSLSASASVSDKAGNTTSATSPLVKIDKTAPNTAATAPTSWNNTNVTVNLNAADSLSGLKATYFKLNGSAQQSGTSVAISSEGVHTLEFWSEDNAGNVEAAKSIEVKIDRTPPTINHTQSPAANSAGWNNSNVTVTFNCGDSGSGIASCTAPQTVTTEGLNQAVTGTATDNAGNTATDPATVNIDKTKPAVEAALDRSANAAGWYNDDVTITFACADDLSGVYSCPAARTLGEGANQSATGAASDAAGNVSDPAGFSSINVDKTAPTLSGAPTTSANAAGWYKSDVIIDWSASDALSGLAAVAPTDSTISGEGDDLSASASVSDKAGNNASASVSEIKIDRTAPNTLASVPTPLDSGWYAAGFNVTLNSIDPMSGVDKTYYSVNGGAAQVYSGPFSHNVPGVSSITFWSVDKAGNIEDKSAPGHSITIKIDNLPPTIAGTRSPVANSFGWNNVPVTVSFNCADGESGLASGVAGCTDAVTVSNEGAAQSVPGIALDNAGNTSSATVQDINIDMTAPTLSGAATTNPNAAGWYKDNVTIAWSGQDALSGIDPTTQPANSVITGEGSALSAGPVTISDKAGNVSSSATVSGIKIDRTPPTISGKTVNDDGTPRSANAAGWFNSAVRVRFTASDALSGLADQADDVVLSSDGVNLSASGTVNDKAENSASATVSGIKIDSQAPQTSANNQCDGKNGWCKGQTATVVLSAADQSGLSGVKEIRYSVNGGPMQSAAGSTANVNVPLAARSGLATVKFYAVDNAGNSELENGVSLKFDNIAPTVTHALNPAANAAGWNNANVTVHFNATDDDGGSGVDPSTITPDQTISTETAGQTITGEALDLAGNKGTDSVAVKLDKTAPTITGAATTAPNASGWYNAAVTVKFTCADALSGIASCPADELVEDNGANQSVSGKAIDRAGNEQELTVSGINIDAVKPAISINGLKAIYTLGEAAALTCSATDTESGIAKACAITVTGGTASGVGTFTYSATAADKAGNTQTVTGSYKVIYKWSGFLQPINDTAHQIGTSTSIFKGGSTVPVKLQLKKVDGSIVQASSLPLWLTPAKGSLTTAAVDESVYSEPATSGTTYRWDATAQQYIFNWSTKGQPAGYYYRIGVTLDDGQIYYVNIGLR